jgi:hypothetical protein
MGKRKKEKKKEKNTEEYHDELDNFFNTVEPILCFLRTT